MSWCISITIDEESRKDALRRLEQIVESIKVQEEVFYASDRRSGTIYSEYDSYEGLG